MNFSEARKNMVDCQIHTNGVISPLVLNAFETIERESYVPENIRNVVYCDENIFLGEGRFLLEPITHAKMLEALKLRDQDTVLDVGSATGYASAILSKIVRNVIALEENSEFTETAKSVWHNQGYNNITPIKGSLSKGCPQHAPYDAIVIAGAVAEVPSVLVNQLAPHGKLITIIKSDDQAMGQVTLIQSLGEKGFSSYTLFEAGAPYMKGFEPKPRFAF